MNLGDGHCGRCNVCTRHAILPCECGGVSLYQENKSALEVSDEVIEVRNVIVP